MALPLLTTPTRGTHGVGGHQPAVAPFAWQSNKVMLFYFTENSVSENKLCVQYRPELASLLKQLQDPQVGHSAEAQAVQSL